MFLPWTRRGALLAACTVAVVLSGHALSTGNPGANQNPTAELDLLRLQSQFHEASALGDTALMYSLWADDATFTSPAGTFTGPQEITDFLASGATWGRQAALTASYKSDEEIHGNRASFGFECILVDMGTLDPLNDSLSTIPFGNQTPGVQIVQHSNATCTAVRQGSRWLFQSFLGGAGPR